MYPQSGSATVDVDKARADTPGCANVAHFNNAGAALPPSVVTDAVVDHLRREAAIGGYEAAAEAAPAIQRTYDAVAELLNCRADEVAIVESATRAWEAAFTSIPLGEGDRILTARAEYASNAIAYLQAVRRRGVKVEVIDDDADGQVDVADLRRRVDSHRGSRRDRREAGDVKLIAVTHVPTQGGLVNPAAEIGAVANEAGVPYLLDACQSAGQLPLDVAEIGCDFLSATGRKYLRAPRGTGFLYVRAETAAQLEPPALDLRSANWVAPDKYEPAPGAQRFEKWEGSVAGYVGLGKAVDYALGVGVSAIEERVTRLAAALRSRLESRPGVQVHDLGRRRCGIVTFTVAGVTPAEVRETLMTERINTSITYAGSARFDLPRRHLEQLVRASIHYYNTEEEIDRLLAALPAPRSRPLRP